MDPVERLIGSWDQKGFSTFRPPAGPTGIYNTTGKEDPLTLTYDVIIQNHRQKYA
jgi:hypothetical protein